MFTYLVDLFRDSENAFIVAVFRLMNSHIANLGRRREHADHLSFLLSLLRNGQSERAYPHSSLLTKGAAAGSTGRRNTAGGKFFGVVQIEMQE